MNSRSSHQDVFYKKVPLTVFQFPQKNICAGVSFKYVYCSSAGNFIKKRLQHRRLTPVSFANFLRFFKNISGRMLLEKHWISLKTVPIAFPVNVSNTGQQKGFELFFLRSAYGKFVNISMEPFIKVFLVLQFSLLYHGDLYLHGFMNFNHGDTCFNEYTETVFK